jgi:hypothetical protein
MMFVDPALAEAARYALSWSPPAIVLPVGMLNGLAADRQEITDGLDERDLRQAEWLQEGQRVRAKLREVVFSVSSTADLRSSLGMLIDLVEQKAVQTSRDGYPLLDRMKRHLREIADIRPEQREFAERAIERIEKAILRELEERLDFALFLRALLSEHDPDAREGATLDNPDELERHLNSILAS